MANSVMVDGFQTWMKFSNAPDITLYEHTVKPPALIGGSIDVTNMRNDFWRTFAPKRLVELGEITMSCAYSPSDVYDTGGVEPLTVLTTLMHHNQIIYLYWPALAILTFWGFITQVEPEDNTEGEQPKVTITIRPSNINSNGLETAPTFADVGAPGTPTPIWNAVLPNSPA